MTTTRQLGIIAGAALALAPWVWAGDALDALELRADAAGRGALAAPADQKFTVDVHGLMLFRYDWNHRDGKDTAIVAGGGHEDTIGFQAAYTKLQVGGKIISDAWNYFFQFKFSESTGAAVLDDAWGSYTFEGGWTVKWGQFKLPFLREETTSDTMQLAANRSVTNSTFTLARADAVMASWEGDAARFSGAFSDGSKSNGSDFTSPLEADWAGTVRAEWKWAGEWKAAKDFTSFPDSPAFGEVGAALHYQSGGHSFATADTRVLGATVETQVEGNGWNLYGAGVYRRTETAGSPTYTDWGFLAQGGVFVSSQWELFARYDAVVPDGDRATSDTVSTVTVGANHYFIPASQAAKLTLDFEWFAGTQSKGFAPSSTLTGLLPSDRDGQWNIQIQMQIVF